MILTSPKQALLPLVWKFRVMPMGLCGAPGTFQMLMDDAFAQPTSVRNISVSFQDSFFIYLDDVCVFSLLRAFVTFACCVVQASWAHALCEAH